MPVTEDKKPNDSLGEFTNYKQKYSSMKNKLKAILYVSIYSIIPLYDIDVSTRYSPLEYFLLT